MIISIRSKDNHRPTAVEALRRAKFKFPGRQKILQSNKWGFTKYPREVSHVKRNVDQVTAACSLGAQALTFPAKEGDGRVYMSFACLEH